MVENLVSSLTVFERSHISEQIEFKKKLAKNQMEENILKKPNGLVYNKTEFLVYTYC